MEDFIRQRMMIEGAGSITIVRTTDGRFQANTQRGRTNAFAVDIADDPADALWNTLVPYTMRRNAPSGRSMAPEGSPPPPEVEDLLAAPEAPATAPDDLEDLLAL